MYENRSVFKTESADLNNNLSNDYEISVNSSLNYRSLLLNVDLVSSLFWTLSVHQVRHYFVKADRYRLIYCSSCLQDNSCAIYPKSAGLTSLTADYPVAAVKLIINKNLQNFANDQ